MGAHPSGAAFKTPPASHSPSLTLRSPSTHPRPSQTMAFAPCARQGILRGLALLDDDHGPVRFGWFVAGPRSPLSGIHCCWAGSQILGPPRSESPSLSLRIPFLVLSESLLGVQNGPPPGSRAARPPGLFSLLFITSSTT